MASPPNNPRAGGKIQKIPLRRSTHCTPYDRPHPPVLSSPRKAWFAKLLEPASRIVGLFSSIFSKRPAALPAVTEYNQKGKDAPEAPHLIHENFDASPAEIAKAYTDSRFSKTVPATRGIRNLKFQENRQQSNELSRGIPRIPSLAITGTPKVSDIGYLTPRIHGGSAIHGTFIKLQTSARYRSRRCIDVGPSTKYELASTKNKKAFKRRISDLDDGVAFSGHLRKIRKKYQVTTPLRKLSSSHTLPFWGQHVKDKVDDRNDSTSQLTKDMLCGRALKTMQEIDWPKFLEAHEIGNSGCSLPPVSAVPFKSSDLPKEKVTDDTSLDTVTDLGNNATIKFDERATWPSNATLPEDKVLEKSSYINGEGLFTSGASSGLPTSTSHVSSISPDSATFGLSRDIPPVASNTSSVSVPIATSSNNLVASGTNRTAATIFSTNSLFQFDSSSTLVASKPLVLTTNKSDAITQGTGSTASPSFGNDAVTPVTSMASFGSATNLSALSSVFSSINNTSLIPASFSSSDLSTSAVASVTNGTAAAIFSTNSLFQFDSSSTLVASKPLVLTTDKSDAITQRTGSTASPSFGITDAVTPVASMASFGSATNLSALSSVFSSIDSTSSIGASSLFSSITCSGSGSVGSTSSAPATTLGSGFPSAGAFSSSTLDNSSSLVMEYITDIDYSMPDDNLDLDMAGDHWMDYSMVDDNKDFDIDYSMPDDNMDLDMAGDHWMDYSMVDDNKDLDMPCIS